MCGWLRGGDKSRPAPSSPRCAGAVRLGRNCVDDGCDQPLSVNCGDFASNAPQTGHWRPVLAREIQAATELFSSSLWWARASSRGRCCRRCRCGGRGGSGRGCGSCCGSGGDGRPLELGRSLGWSRGSRRLRSVGRRTRLMDQLVDRLQHVFLKKAERVLDLGDGPQSGFPGWADHRRS